MKNEDGKRKGSQVSIPCCHNYNMLHHGARSCGALILEFAGNSQVSRGIDSCQSARWEIPDEGMAKTGEILVITYEW